jgi:hypothetical protein
MFFAFLPGFFLDLIQLILEIPHGALRRSPALDSGLFALMGSGKFILQTGLLRFEITKLRFKLSCAGCSDCQSSDFQLRAFQRCRKRLDVRIQFGALLVHVFELVHQGAILFDDPGILGAHLLLFLL